MNSDRRSFLTWMTATGWTAGAALRGFGQGRQPNILWIMSDDHATHAMSCYGSRVNRTPHLDRLASEGVRFDKAFCTNSLCTPARATFLTGKYSHKNGVYTIVGNPPFDGSQDTFPKALQAAGYRTGLIGKWHLVSEPTGFDYWNILPGQGKYYNPDMLEMGRKRQRQGYITDILTDDAVRFIRDSPRKNPFCLLLHHKAVHSPWLPGKKHRAMLASADLQEPPSFNDNYQGRASATSLADMRLGSEAGLSDLAEASDVPWRQWTVEQRKKWNYQRFMKHYIATVASLDEGIGRLLTFLDDAGLGHDTAVFYTTDNGVFLGDHGWFDKRLMYEPALRLPLLARYPRLIKAGQVEKRLVCDIDFASTLIDLAGGSVPSDVQGVSLLPLLKGESPRNWRRSIYYQYYEFPVSHRVLPHYGVRTERYKLIHFPWRWRHGMLDATGGGEWELYDLRTDPDEMKNRYDDPAVKEVVAELKSELARLRKQYDVPDGGPVW